MLPNQLIQILQHQEHLTREVFSDGHISDGTPEGMFNFEPEITSPESPHVIQPTHHFVFCPDFNESRINLAIKYQKLLTKSSHDFGKVLKDFKSESKRRLEKAINVNYSCANLVASDSVWEAY